MKSPKFFSSSFKLMQRSIVFVVLISFFGLYGNSALAQTANGRFYSFDFTSLAAANSTGSTSLPSYFANTTYIDSVGMTITRGAGLSNGTVQAAGAWCFQNLNETTEALAITANDYVEFKIKGKSGFEFRMDSLIFLWQYQTGGTTINFAVRTSLDNYAATIAGVAQAAAGAGPPAQNYVLNTTKFAFANPMYVRDSVIVRMYIWGAAQTNRDFRFSDSSASTVSHDIAIWGRTNATKTLMQAFDFSTSLGSEATRPTYTCDNARIDTAGVTITRGAGTTAQTTTAGSYGAGTLNATSVANAKTANQYFQFALKPKPGYEYALDRIMLRYFSTATTGPSSYELRSSKDNYIGTIATGSFTRGATTRLSVTPTAVFSSDSAITFRLYVFGASTATDNLRFTDGTANNTFNYDIAFYGDVTTATIPTAILSAPGAITTCLGGGISLKISTLGGTAPFTVWLKDNLGAQRTHVQSAADSTITIYPQTNRTYTLDSVKDVMSHKASSVTGSVSISVTASPVITSAGTTISRTLSHLDGYTLTYASGDSCKSWVKITDSVGGTNPGSTTCTAEVLASSPANTTARTYVPRRLNLAPTTNGVARVTLFYSQAEFTAFNALVTYQQKLPINSTDTVGVKSKMRIRRTSGSLETASTTTFTPDSVTWNSSSSTWEVNFRVNDGVLGGNYYLSPQFTSTKLITGVTHLASTPVTGQTSATVTVSWDSLAGVSQYRMRFRPVGSSTWNVSTITGKQRVLTNLSFNSSYEVQIRAYESATIQGEYTTTYTFSTPQEPNKLPSCQAPTNIVSNVTSPATATISWTGATYASTYLVEMRVKNTLVWGGTSTAGTSINLVSLTPNTTYEYRVRTSCQPGYTETEFSGYSTTDTFKTTAMSDCGTVTNLSTVATTTTSGTIRWSKVNYATSYFVQMRLKNTATWGGMSTTDTTLTLSNLVSSSIYEYRVRANCNAVPAVTTTNIGAFSAVAEFTTASAPVLSACLPPTNVIASPSSSSVAVSWTAASNAASYFVNLKPAASTNWGGATVLGTSRTFTGLTPSTNYHLRIRTNCTPGATLTSLSNFTDTIYFVTTSLANKAVFANTNEANEWSVYPNPTRDNLHIEFNCSSTENVKIFIVDVTGRLVSTTDVIPMLGQNNMDVSLGHLSDGIYVIRIQQRNEIRFVGSIRKIGQ